MRRVLVVGATGTVGSRVCERLAAAGAEVAAASRSGAVRFDWYDPATWEGALESADRMYLIAPDGDSDPVAAMRPFLELALEKGVKRAVLQSGSPVPAGPRPRPGPRGRRRDVPRLGGAAAELVHAELRR